MKAWVLESINNLQWKKTEMPRVRENEVLVRVATCGICGSDIPRIFSDGAHNMPLIPGHEFCGVVEQVGSKVDSTWIGKRVGVFPLIPCKECTPCMMGKYEMCEHYDYLGSRSDGGYAEYVTVPEWNLIELPDEVSYEQAAMLEPMAVAAHSMRRMDIKESDNIAVIGPGTIGLLLTMMLLEKGYNNVFVIGNKAEQCIKACEIGLNSENFCNQSVQSADAFIRDKTVGKNADVVFECVGNNTTINQAVSIASAGGRICFVGNPHSDIGFEKSIYWKILRKQLTISGTWNSSFKPLDSNNDDWVYVLDLLKRNRIKPEKLITHRLPLEDLTKGLEVMRDKSEYSAKIMIYNSY